MIFAKYSQKYLKNRIKQIENEKFNLNEKVDKYEKYKQEREKFESQIENLNKKYNFALFEKEQLLKKIKQKDFFVPIREKEISSTNLSDLTGRSDSRFKKKLI